LCYSPNRCFFVVSSNIFGSLHCIKWYTDGSKCSSSSDKENSSENILGTGTTFSSVDHHDKFPLIWEKTEKSSKK